MRKLMIKRKKAIAGCAMKIKMYIEDIENYELEIRGHRCRKLGDIKNNSEIIVEIGNGEQKIFAISDLPTKDVCGDMIIIPAGNENIVISGKNILSPVSGNPFVFDKNYKVFDILND